MCKCMHEGAYACVRMHNAYEYTYTCVDARSKACERVRMRGHARLLPVRMRAHVRVCLHGLPNAIPCEPMPAHLGS